jgi:hypothetical protein
MARDAPAAESSGTSITTPGSLTDLAKALRETTGAAKDFGEIFGSVWRLYDRHRSKKAAKRLYDLHFAPQGMRAPVQRIAAGQGTKNDFLLIERLLTETASRVEKDIKKLAAFRDRLREQVGWNAVQALDMIIHGQFGSKPEARERLAHIVLLSKADPPPLDEIRSAAQQVERNIDQLNKKLRRLHDLILKSSKR